MNEISHEQARKYIHLDQPNAGQHAELAAHLAGCPDCQAYAHLQERLAPRLSRAMHARWDPLQTPVHAVGQAAPLAALQNRRKSMFRNGFHFAYSGLLLAILLFGVAAVLTLVRPAPSQPNGALPTGTTSAAQSQTTSAQTFSSRLDSSVCARQGSTPPPGVQIPYPATQILAGGEAQVEDFTFNLWLYCDERLKTDNPQKLSGQDALGIYAAWKYNGPLQKGEIWDMYGFEPDVRRSSGMPHLYRSGGSGMWLALPGGVTHAGQLAQSGEPIRFAVRVQVNQVLYGAVLSFRLESGQDGYIPVDVAVQAEPVVILPTATPGAQTTARPTPADPISTPGIRPTGVISSVQTGLVAYVSPAGADDAADIFVIDPAKGKPTNLTRSPASDTNPVWSPDGRQIAFQSDRSGAKQIFVMDAGGAHIRQLTTENFDTRIQVSGEEVKAFYRGLSWSPDGKYLLAELVTGLGEFNGGFDNRLALIDAAGGEARYFEGGPFTSPQWSPDGTKIAFLGYGSRGNSILAWDAASLVNDGKVKQVGVTASPDWWETHGLQWSPDSKSLAVIALSSTNRYTLRVMQANGSRSQTVYTFPDSTHFPVPVWTLDSRRLILANEQEILIANADGSGLRRLAALDAPLEELHLSPDDAYLLFTTGDPLRQTYILDVAAALMNPSVQAAPLVSGADAAVYQAVWQPVLR